MDEPKIVELVLDGAADAVSGRYHIAITVQNTQTGAGVGTTRWQGNWTATREKHGEILTRVIVLENMINGEIDRYELAADGTLRPVSRDGHGAAAYSAAQIGLYTLQPLRRDSWNYGID